MNAKAIFTAILTEAAMVKKGVKIKFADLKLRRGRFSDLAEMVRLESDVKITVEVLQPGLFDDGDDDEGGE